MNAIRFQVEAIRAEFQGDGKRVKVLAYSGDGAKLVFSQPLATDIKVGDYLVVGKESVSR